MVATERHARPVIRQQGTLRTILGLHLRSRSRATCMTELFVYAQSLTREVPRVELIHENPISKPPRRVEGQVSTV